MKRFLSIILVAAMVLTFTFAAQVPAFAAEGDTTLRVGIANLSGYFSPFFAGTDYDQDIASVAMVNLLTTDRQGAVVEKGKTGETRSFENKDYTYYGPADLTITENADGTIDYDFELREDMTFSDGTPLTADDVIFSMYVLADPTYDGTSTFNALPIKGMDEYRKGMTSLASLLIAAGKDNTDFSYWTKDQQTAFWSRAKTASEAIAQEVCDYCKSSGYNSSNDPVEACAANWGYRLPSGATIADFGAAMMAAYENDIVELVSVENAGSSIYDVFPGWDEYAAGVKTGTSTERIEGIQKTGDYSLRVTLDKIDAAAIYQLGVAIAPLHYYGDRSKYDYDNNKFGFDKGDLSKVHSKSSKPLGAGPYEFQSYRNGVVSFVANESYYLGAPKTKYLNFVETADSYKLNSLLAEALDISEVSYAMGTAEGIRAANSNGQITGNKLTTYTMDNPGYGYVGFSAKAVKVGNDPGSEASKNLRKAIATVLAIYRDVTVDSYYGGAASVINYPISNTSWAAPQETDPDYTVAFSKDVGGNDIFTPGMNDDEKEAAALQAALGFFEAAGYTITDGRLTAAPDGAEMEYEVWIPAEGAGDHPSFMMLNLASDALKKIGFNLIVKDLYDSSDLWAGIENDQVPIWCAAWESTADPDMYQIYYSGVESGAAPGGSNYMYDIADPELDKLILEGRNSLDTEYRKTIYKACLDIVMDWAVELPVYQRQNAVVFSTERVNISTVTPDMTPAYGWMAEIHNIESYVSASGDEPAAGEVDRIFGASRYDTSIKSADALKEQLGLDKFDNVIIACGTNYADALAGSYLSCVKKAPILLVRNRQAEITLVQNYIKANLNQGGTIYLLGGSAVVPDAATAGLSGFNIKRLWGADRYATNVAILEEAGVSGNEIIVASGNGFADSLSASATGKPILLVKNAIQPSQKAYVESLAGKEFYLIGGTGAVNVNIENYFKALGSVTRIGGATRFDTSMKVAETFFKNPKAAVLAYGQDFPDGLCGGSVANAMGGPLLLATTGKAEQAAAYAQSNGIKTGAVLGGPTLISDIAVRYIFQMSASDKIWVK